MIDVATIPGPEVLTSGQTRVLQAIATSVPLKAFAQRSGIGDKVVSYHVVVMKRRLGLTGYLQNNEAILTRYAIHHRMVSVEGKVLPQVCCPRCRGAGKVFGTESKTN
jgi:hypothetical protein